MRIYYALAGVAALCLTACKDQIQLPYRAVGNEPGWMAIITEQGFEILTHYGEKKLTAPLVAPEALTDGLRYQFKAQNLAVTLTIEHTACQDVMSGQTFPDQTTLKIGEETFTGCGTPLLQETKQILLPAKAPSPPMTNTSWLGVSLNGEPLPPNSRFDLKLDDTGRLSGKSGCNRYSAGYEMSGEKLAVSPGMVSTKMACPPPLMTLEAAFTRTLQSATSIRFTSEGFLEISSPDGSIRFTVAP